MKCTGRRRLLAAAAVACMFWIWSNSLWPAEQSAGQSGWVLELLTPLLKWLPIPQTLWHTMIRKLAHMAEYALLGLLWERASIRTERTPAVSRLGKTLAVCMAVALMDETLQTFVPGRAGLVADVWIDLLGALGGVLSGWLFEVMAGARAKGKPC